MPRPVQIRPAAASIPARSGTMSRFLALMSRFHPKQGPRAVDFGTRLLHTPALALTLAQSLTKESE